MAANEFDRSPASFYTSANWGLSRRPSGVADWRLRQAIQQCELWLDRGSCGLVSNERINMSIGDGADIGFATMHGRDYPCIRQFTVFMENRVGQLLDVVRRFEGSKVRIVALSIMDSFECACVRFLLSHPEQGREILERAGLALIETDLIGIELPTGNQPLLRVCTALLQAEVNIVQAYPLLMRPNEQPVVAVLVDNIEMAMDTLASKKFRMITEDDLADIDID